MAGFIPQVKIYNNAKYEKNLNFGQNFSFYDDKPLAVLTNIVDIKRINQLTCVIKV